MEDILGIVPPASAFSFVDEIETQGGRAYRYLASVEVEDREERVIQRNLHYLMVALPDIRPPDRRGRAPEGSHFIWAAELGENVDTDSRRSRVSVASAPGMRFEGSYLRASFMVEREYGTNSLDPNCPSFERTEPKMRTTYEVFCGLDDCAAVAREEEVLEPGRERDCDGHVEVLSGNDFEVEITREGEQILIRRISGRYPVDGERFEIRGLTTRQAVSAARIAPI